MEMIALLCHFLTCTSIETFSFLREGTIFISASDNTNVIEININPFNLHSASGTISSPFFPIQYPGELRSQYTIQCSVTTHEKCSIRLIFTDHRLADQSILQVCKLCQLSGFASVGVIMHYCFTSIKIHNNLIRQFKIEPKFTK